SYQGRDTDMYMRVVVGSMLSVVPLAAAILVLQRCWRGGLTEGAVKGCSRRPGGPRRCPGGGDAGTIEEGRRARARRPLADGPADGSAEAPASAEGVGDHLGGVGDQGVLPLGVLVVPAGQDGDDDRLGVACGPQHRDVVAGAVVAAAGLVADLPVVRDAGPDQVVTGGVALQ